MKIKFKTTPSGERSRLAILTGRRAWALTELAKAGEKGCTPIENPAPRWSAYVHELRHQEGLEIITIHEPHGGEFAGTHARYILKTKLEILEVFR